MAKIKKTLLPAKADTNIPGKLLTALSQLIEQSQVHVANYANSTLTGLFWHIGKRINKEVLDNQRAGYGKQIVPTLSAQLEKKYGRNFTEKNVRRMIKFAQEFSTLETVVSLSQQLSWSHFVELLPLEAKERFERKKLS